MAVLVCKTIMVCTAIICATFLAFSLIAVNYLNDKDDKEGE